VSIFDTPVERRGTDSIKWGKYAGRDILPLWVADMDFAAPPAVLAALHRRVEEGVFGYGHPWPIAGTVSDRSLGRRVRLGHRTRVDRLAAGPGQRAQHRLPGGRRRGADGDAGLSALPVGTRAFPAGH
jgi:hypothetical protein